MLILEVASAWLGPPASEVRAALEAKQGQKELEELYKRTCTVSSWEELMRVY